jgi:aldehyde:ferredoxin oxidoreductase
MFGYRGKVLDVDLTRNRTTERELDQGITNLYIGCVGLGGKILYDEVPTWVSPFDPENLLIFATGPVTGTPGIAAGRHSVVTKSPLTGVFGDASAGGFWGAELKKSGYDAIVFRGKSRKPVYLQIRDGNSELQDASSYWGMTTRAADRAIRKDIGDLHARVANIGPAGENLVRFAGITNDETGRIAARCGVGAVMGSKMLKAIVVSGSKPVPVYDEEEIRTCLKELTQMLNADSATKDFMKWGTSGYLDSLMEVGDTPTRNWTLGKFDGIDGLTVQGGYGKIRKNQRTCYACTIHCRPVVAGGQERYPTEENIEGPEYETLGVLGSNLSISSIEQVVKLNDLCNLYGLDTISTGGVLGWAMECYERGLLTKESLDGVPLEFGNGDAAIRAVEAIAHRQGIGDLLAEGTRRASRFLGHESSKWAIEVKGLELPMHDPRAFQAMSLTYAFSAVGADHMEGGTMSIESLPEGKEHPSFPEYGLKGTDRLGVKDKARIAFVMQNAYQAATALGYCLLAAASTITNYPLEYNVRFYSAATGLQMSAEDFLTTGERIYNLKRAFNFKHGMQKDEDRLPERLLKEPLPSGGSKGSVARLDSMARDFFEIRGWDFSSGKPTRERLQSLGMNDVANELWPR